MSEVATIPSVYSQPSPEFEHFSGVGSYSPPESSSIYPETISPPDTPRTMGERERVERTSPDVSPISATPSPTAMHHPELTLSGSKRYSSNLPVPRSNTKKFWKLPNAGKRSEDPQSSQVHWDEYSGEPTAEDKGKPASATPGSIKLRETPSPLRLKTALGTSTHISSGNIPARKRVGSREVADAPIIMRPEWKGAGGRHSIVKPLFDKPFSPGQSRKFPEGSHKKWLEEQEKEREEQERLAQQQLDEQRLARQTEEQERKDQEEEAIEAAKQEKERAMQEQRERQREQQQRMARERIEKAKRERERILHGQEESERRAKERVERVSPPPMPAPLRIASRSPTSPKAPTPTMPITYDRLEANVQSAVEPLISQGSSGATTPVAPDQRTRITRLNNLMNDDTRSPLARNPSSEELRDRKNQALPSLPRNGQPSPLSQLTTDQSFSNGSGDEYPVRDSSLSDAGQIEARFRANLQHVALPDQSQSRFSATTVATTAYDNSPPQTPEMKSTVSSNTNTPESILNRKRPVASSGVIRRKPTPSMAGTPNGVTREDSKSLPKPPPDAEIVDPIQTLQAKQDVLRRRRRNLETVINELTNVVQPSSIAYDRASRLEIKKTVAGLEKELSEVVKDEHETGLKLHRAWKRHEDFAPYEPTSIWVRRVTT
ncbi:uncharacterized protein KY384_000667 [Bacidia gigantensis]|uniref:uncharacterized protein n=1 Tax=Bacidia gigantensis TaxID=2732470 RepID=UPI001D046F77|nr:uncharacterized protein KY384_000667 [Bacidia gigantensis]KAG8525905.1 hypothetical protein KY384_000667 [Bacidia gigantensis]